MRAVHNRFEALLQATPDAVLVQVDRRVAYANDAAYQLFGATRSATGEGSLLGSLLWERLHPDSHDAVRARLPLVAGGQGEAPPVEEKWVRLDGSPFLAEVSARGVTSDVRPEARRYLDNIVGASAHMNKLIDELLTYARLGRRGADLQRTDLNDLLRRINTDLAARAARSV